MSLPDDEARSLMAGAAHAFAGYRAARKAQEGRMKTHAELKATLDALWDQAVAIHHEIDRVTAELQAMELREAHLRQSQAPRPRYVPPEEQGSLFVSGEE